MVLSFLLVITGHAQSTQNNKIAKSLQYLQKVRSEIHVLCRWSSQLIPSFLTRSAYFSSGMPKVLKITSMHCLCKISTTNWLMKLMICMLVSMKVFYKFIVSFLLDLARHVHSTRVNLEYLCDIIRKKLRMMLEA